MNTDEPTPGPGAGKDVAPRQGRLQEDRQEMQDVTALSVLASVFRAWFGVQSEKNRQRDFNTNRPTAFLVAGLLFTVAMVIAVIVAVNLALSAAGR